MKTERNSKLEKWPGYVNTITDWWEELTDEEKESAKQHYEKVREYQGERKRNGDYTSMYNTTKLDIYNLTSRELYRIWAFKDYKIEK